MGSNAYDPAWHGWLVLAGWSALVVCWHSSIVALVVAAWRSLRPAASPRRLHAVALAAIAVALVLALLTPTFLSSAAVAPRAPQATGGSTDTSVAPVPTRAPVFLLTDAASAVAAAPRARDVVAWLGLAWMAGCVVLVARLAWGIAAVAWIRARATAPASRRAVDAAAETCDAWHLRTPPIVVSAFVEAPVALGVRHPLVVLPPDVESRLPPDALARLIAHELAHVARRDYAMNLAQSLADAVLFFSPGVRWLSRVAREAREFCCDDLAVARCAGPGDYARALMLLADVRPASRARLALGAAGPRLVVRIRRLLKEEAMARHPRHVALIVALLAVVVAGGRSLVAASVAGVVPPAAIVAPVQDPPRMPEAPAQPIAPPVETAVPIPYPDEALSAAVQGPVVLAVTTDPSGQPLSVTAVAGDPLLTPAAVGAVGGWRFAASSEPQAFLLGVNVVPRDPALAMLSAAPLRVGGNIRPPAKVVHVNPAYPAEAQEARLQGVVIIQARIGADGIVDSAYLLRSVPGLDVAALTSVLQWQFTPTQLNGAAVPVTMTVTVNFTLR